MSGKTTWIVEIEFYDERILLEGKTSLKEHIETAIGHWGGSNPPDDPFFPSNIKKVSARHGYLRGKRR